jgi:hypothetical protein
MAFTSNDAASDLSELLVDQLVAGGLKVRFVVHNRGSLPARLPASRRSALLREAPF